MMLHGCYADDVNFKTTEPNFIYRDNVVWWDAGHGVTVDGASKVTQWTSKENRDGETVVTTPQNGGTALHFKQMIQRWQMKRRLLSQRQMILYIMQILIK